MTLGCRRAPCESGAFLVCLLSISVAFSGCAGRGGVVDAGTSGDTSPGSGGNVSGSGGGGGGGGGGMSGSGGVTGSGGAAGMGTGGSGGSNLDGGLPEIQLDGLNRDALTLDGLAADGMVPACAAGVMTGTACTSATPICQGTKLCLCVQMAWLCL
jgi:hypothetical protein